MVNARLRERARLAFFFANPRHFNFVNCEYLIVKLNCENKIVLNPSARLSDSILAAELNKRHHGFSVVFLMPLFSLLTSFCVKVYKNEQLYRGFD